MAVGIVLLELEDVADVGTAPRVNGLVVVAHDHDVFVLLRQKPGDSILRMVRVLIFIHHDVTEALLVCLEHIGVVLQQQIRVHEQVIEVESVRSTQTLLQSRVDSGGHLPHRVNRLLLEITRHNKLVFRLGDAPHEGVYGKALRVDVELGHDFLVQALLIVGVVDGEALREAEALGVGAQHAHAHTVEGRDPHATAPRPDDALKALAHLSGGLVGEGDRKYFPRRHVQVLHEMGDAIGEHARLARACASEYQKRAFRALDSFGLRAIQRGDFYGHRYLLLRTANGKCADAQRGRARKASRGRHRFMCRLRIVSQRDKTRLAYRSRCAKATAFVRLHAVSHGDSRAQSTFGVKWAIANKSNQANCKGAFRGRRKANQNYPAHRVSRRR